MPEPKRKKAPKKKAASKRSRAARKKDFISVLFSFRNEEDVLDELLDRLNAVFDALGVEREYIFVNDDSTDRSIEILLRRSETDPRIKIITMSACFGVNQCYVAGMRKARGDAVVILDTDLQDPPELIPELIAKWREGFEIVHATRSKREGESPFKLMLTNVAYELIHRLGDPRIPVNTGLFKLISRRALDVVVDIGEVDLYLRGVIAWVGFKQASVLYTREQRHAGTGHFPLTDSGPWLEFVRAIFSFSRVPIAIMFFIGLAGLAAGAIAFSAFSILWLLDKDPSTVQWTMSVLIALSGVNLIAISALGVYISRIYNQVKLRPEYIIESTHGFDE